MNAFVIPLVVMNGFAVVIYALIMVLKTYVAAYGNCSLVVNGSRTFTVMGGTYLNKALFENKIYLPSACGGKGTCGFCKVRVTEGVSDPLPVEEILINYKDIRQGYRLSCQTKLRAGISIEIPEELLSIREYKGVVKSSNNVTRDIKRIGIRIDEPKEGLDFKSGQYLMFKVGEDETRGYSIASTERRADEVQIEVKLIPNGLGSSYLHSLTEGDELTFFGPYGQFYLRDTSHKVICVAGGVGLAPMKPIIFETLMKYPNRDVELYYGVRTFEDLYDHDLFIRLQANHPRFHYFPTLEQIGESAASAYPFTKGFVNKTLAENLTDGDRSEAYLCGPPLMINSSIQALLAKDVPEIRILYDKF